ncbi:MAG: class I SAM-dependent methyltransferase [Nocardioidaceae bacterium]
MSWVSKVKHRVHEATATKGAQERPSAKQAATNRANQNEDEQAALQAARATADRLVGTRNKSPNIAMPARSEPGTRVLNSRFFDPYPRFYETSETTALPSRLNLRNEAIFGENRDIIDGARVLDIASHDGRWAFAALKQGARSVVGIEGRPELVEFANESLAQYGIESNRYRFIAADIFAELAEQRIEVDVVLCLGFMYHTLRWNELMTRIRQCKPKYLIIDTAVTDGHRARVQLKVEDVGEQRNAIVDEFTHGTAVVSGKPTVRALRTIVEAYGFELEKLSDWSALVRDNPEDAVESRDYARGYRVTARCRTVD